MNVTTAVAAPVPRMARPSVPSKLLAVSQSTKARVINPVSQYRNGQSWEFLGGALIRVTEPEGVASVGILPGCGCGCRRRS
jgi:hypothetical protein